MNVYDFDDTIYDGDSTKDFWKFCLKRRPIAACALLAAVIAYGQYLFGFIDKTAFKQQFYSFLKYIPSVDDMLSVFWDKNEAKIQTWYLTQKQEDDIIISASPEFLLKPICERLGVRLIASRVDAKTGIYTGENCYGSEKVKRFNSEFPDESISSFYSDSLSDEPLAKIASTAYFVGKNGITRWNT